MPTPLPPGSTGLPFIGQTPLFLRDPKGFVDARQRKYGPVFRTHLFGSNAVFILGADGHRWLFGGEYRYLKNRWPPAIRSLLGPNSVSILEGDAHKARRRLLSPLFGRAQLEATTPWMDGVVQAHLSEWECAPGELALTPRIKALAFEIASRFLVGELPADTRERLSDDFDIWVHGLFVPLPLSIPGTSFARAKAAGARMMRLLRQLVEARVAARESGPAAEDAAPTDVLQALLNARDEEGRALSREALSIEAVAEELQLLFFAGHDTTVTSTTNVMIHLAQHPAVWARARAEQLRLGEGPIDAKRARASVWLTQVIQESMRVLPPINGAFRVTTEDVEYGGFRIPKGYMLAFSPRASHGDPAAFQEPEAFDPERFGPGREEHKRTPLSWIPFGGGPRLCIGQHFAMLEMQVMLGRLVRDYRWELVDNPPTFVALPFPRPMDGGRVRFARRADQLAAAMGLPASR